MSRTRLEADACVVGAGLAGLRAATALREAGLDVVVLEARDRVGGRVRGGSLADGTTVVERGAQWLGPGQERAYGLVRRLGLATFPTYDEGLHLVRLGDRPLRVQRGAAPPLGPLGLLDVLRATKALDRAAARVPLEAPWEARGAEQLDAETFATWVRRNLRTTAGRAFFSVAVPAIFAAEPANLSLLHALFYLRSGMGLESLLGTTGGAQQDRVLGGTARLAEGLAAELGEAVRLGAPVHEVMWAADRVSVCSARLEVRARRAIVALPPTLAGRLRYAPALPSDRDQLTQRLPAGAVVKTHLVYDEPWWRAEGRSGQAATDRGPVGFTFDSSPPSGAPGVLTAFAEGRHGLALGRLEPVERQSAVVDAVAALFGPRVRKVEEVVTTDWQAEEWTRGCYGAHHPPGVWTQLGPALRRPVGPLHWAGTETATRWAGYMDGALESGERAAAEVVAALGGAPAP